MKTIDIVGKRYLFFLISAILILPGLVSLVLPSGVRLGVDFTGGSLWEIKFDSAATPSEVKSIFTAAGHDAIVQTTGENTLLIRTKEINAEGPEKAQISQVLTQQFGAFRELRFESVGPVVGNEVRDRAILAIFLASVGILLFIWYAFRKVPGAYRYGACAIAALLHDALLVIGVFSILGRIAGIEIDQLFVTALLTIIGFSVHDTIVVFDRIRENMLRHPSEEFENVVNHSLLQTLGRSLSTSLTVVFTLSALVLFGGSTTRIFALALLIGVISGTYSSIFNASQLLVAWEHGEISRFFRGKRPIIQTPATAS